MRYLVTGGAGFLGSHLCEALVAGGGEVWALDDLSTGARENLAPLENEKRFHFVEGSVLDRAAVADCVGTCDVVLHMAAAVGVKYIVENPFTSIRTNVFGTEVVLEACARFRKKVLIASTSEVYGKQTTGPVREDVDRVLGATTTSRWSYAATKALDEFLALAYHRKDGLRMVIARLFNVVGPRQTGRYGMVLPRFAEQAFKGEAITVYGDGTQTRAFMHADDCVRALLALVEAGACECNVYNVGATEEISILDLAERVRALTGSSSEIVFVPYEEAYESGFEDMPRRAPDVSRLVEAVGFEPRYDLDATIRSVIEDRRARTGKGS